MFTEETKNTVKKTKSTIMLLIMITIGLILIMIIAIPVSYRFSAQYELSKYFETEQYEYLGIFKVKPKFYSSDNISIYCRVIDDKDYDKIKEEVMILKKDIENYLKEHSDDFSGKEIRVYIAGNDVEIEMKNNTNDEDFYNLEFERFWLNREDILESINEDNYGY